MKRMLLLLVITALAIHPLQAQDTEKKADLLKLLNIYGVFEVGDQLVLAIGMQVIDLYRKANPKATEQTLISIQKEVKAVVDGAMRESGGISDKFVEIYGKYFTHAEIKEIITFHESPVGKKIKEVERSLAKDVMVAGQKWGESIGPTVLQRTKTRLKKKGIVIPDI